MDNYKLRTILNKIIKVSNKHKKIKEKNGGDFNIFSILRKENDEVHLHSKFIYELLNPKGSHHQGKLFLDLFVSEALDIENYNKASLKVFREAPTEHGRRIDFLIESSDYIIGIEMKIDAGDQNEQLIDYYNELKKQSKGRKIELIYLTKFGDNPSDKSISNFDLKKVTNKSFVLDIDWWLDKCIYKTKNVPKLNELILQYKALVEKITGKLTDEMEKDMNEIVKSVKDIEAMNTLVNYYPIMWAEKENEFWNELVKSLERRTVFNNKGYEIEFYEHFGEDTHVINNIVKLRHKNGVGELGFYIKKVFKKFSISFDVSQKNGAGLKMWLSFNGVQGGSKNDEEVINLLKKYLLIDGKYIELNDNIRFYAKDVIEPNCLLFDDEEFKFHVKDLTDKIVKGYVRIKG